MGDGVKYRHAVWAFFHYFFTDLVQQRRDSVWYKTTKINAKIMQFLNLCRSRITRIKQQKLDLPISHSMDTENGRQLILQTQRSTACYISL